MKRKPRYRGWRLVSIAISANVVAILTWYLCSGRLLTFEMIVGLNFLGVATAANLAIGLKSGSGLLFAWKDDLGYGVVASVIWSLANLVRHHGWHGVQTALVGLTFCFVPGLITSLVLGLRAVYRRNRNPQAAR